MIVPWQDIPPDTLDNLIQEFVTRDGTDYGEQEMPLETRVNQVKGQLEQGEAVVWFDETTESINILPRDELIRGSLPSADG